MISFYDSHTKVGIFLLGFEADDGYVVTNFRLVLHLISICSTMRCVVFCLSLTFYFFLLNIAILYAELENSKIK